MFLLFFAIGFIVKGYLNILPSKCFFVYEGKQLMKILRFVFSWISRKKNRAECYKDLFF